MKHAGSTIVRLLVVTAGLVLATGCQSTETRARKRLPFHVALAPVGENVFEDQTAEGADEERLVRLAAYTQGTDAAEFDVVHVLGDELQRSAFSEVTILPPVEGGSEGRLVADAKARGADLLMTLEQVSYDADLETKTNHWNWFWFLTGPAVYFFTDREYRLDSTIEVALYDVHSALQTADGDYLLDETALVRRFRAKADWVETRFSDRAEGALDWAKSLLIPTNMLRKRGQQARRKIALESLRSMALELSEDILVDAEFVTRPSSRKTLFYLSEDEVGAMEPELVAQGGGEPTHVELVASILHNSRGRATEFGLAEVRCGDAILDLRRAQGETVRVGDAEGSITVVDDGSVGGGWVRKRINVRLPLEATLKLGTAALDVDPTIQIVLEDPRGDTQTRSWTLPIPSQQHERMVGVIEARAKAGDDVRAKAAVYRPGSN